MRLHKLRITSFGAIESVDVEFGVGLNVLYGPNDLGKSTMVAAIRLGLHAFYRSQDMELEPQLRYLQGELGRVLALEDAAEGISAFLQKRKPVWKGR